MTTREQKEEAAREYAGIWTYSRYIIKGFIDGAKWAEKQMKWFTMSEKEPSTGDYVLLVNEDNEAYEGACEVKVRSIWIGPQGMAKDYIKRWMPLPAPPAQKGGTNE